VCHAYMQIGQKASLLFPSGEICMGKWIYAKSAWELPLKPHGEMKNQVKLELCIYFFVKYNSASKRTTVLFLDNLIKSGSLKRETFKSMHRTKFMLVEIISFLERKLPHYFHHRN